MKRLLVLGALALSGCLAAENQTTVGLASSVASDMLKEKMDSAVLKLMPAASSTAEFYMEYTVRAKLVPQTDDAFVAVHLRMFADDTSSGDENVVMSEDLSTDSALTLLGLDTGGSDYAKDYVYSS